MAHSIMGQGADPNLSAFSEALVLVSGDSLNFLRVYELQNAT
jgi:hypothetical protein